MREEAYCGADEVLLKISHKPSLLNTWAGICPGVLRSKEREIEYHTEGTATYLEVMKEKVKVEMVYEAVAALKGAELHEGRVIKSADVSEKQTHAV